MFDVRPLSLTSVHYINCIFGTQTTKPFIAPEITFKCHFNVTEGHRQCHPSKSRLHLFSVKNSLNDLYGRLKSLAIYHFLLVALIIETDRISFYFSFSAPNNAFFLFFGVYFSAEKRIHDVFGFLFFGVKNSIFGH